MSRRAASISQADIARAIRAARQAGADAVEVIQCNGTTIRVLLKAPTIAPADEFEAWEKEHESAKAARRRNGD
jgi:2,4-dienoyl-CoA reductase-like NADH-dependent reductase (Old Yellow Enzyme family)